MIYFLFFRSGVKARRGVEFRHSTRITSNSAENDRWSVLTLGSLGLACCEQLASEVSKVKDVIRDVIVMGFVPSYH